MNNRIAGIEVRENVVIIFYDELDPEIKKHV